MTAQNQFQRSDGSAAVVDYRANPSLTILTRSIEYLRLYERVVGNSDPNQKIARFRVAGDSTGGRQWK